MKYAVPLAHFLAYLTTMLRNSYNKQFQLKVPISNMSHDVRENLSLVQLQRTIHVSQLIRDTYIYTYTINASCSEADDDRTIFLREDP